MKLPKWGEVHDKSLHGGELTALEQFVFDNEPADSAERWREQLEAALSSHLHTALRRAIFDTYMRMWGKTYPTKPDGTSDHEKMLAEVLAKLAGGAK